MKKLYFLLIFWFFLTKANAQWVTIPDGSFSYYLNLNYPQCMNGNLMDTTCNAIINAKKIYMGPIYNVFDLTGIQYFKSLDSLSLNDSPLSFIPAFPDSLKYISLNYFGSNYSNLTLLPPLPPYLKYLFISGHSIQALPQLPNSIKYLGCYRNKLNALPVFPITLDTLNLRDNLLTSLSNLPDSLIYLNCSENQITSIASLPTSIKTLICNDNLLTSLPNLPQSLEFLNCDDNNIISLPALPNTLLTLNCNDNQLAVLPILPNFLVNLSCSNNQLTFLPILPDSLITLYCANNQLTFLPFLPDSLKNLHCELNLLTSLPPLPQSLITLYCAFNQLSNLPTPLPNQLHNLGCNNNPLSSLPIIPPNLRFLACNNTSISILPELPDSMVSLGVYNNPNLLCLPKLPKLTRIWYYNTAIQCLPNYPTISGWNPIVDPPFSTYPLCDLFNNPNNCEIHWNINGRLFSDVNNNCNSDTIEQNLANLKIQLFQNGNLIQQVFSIDDGSYAFNTDTGTYNYTVDTTNLPILITCPSSGFHTSVLTPADSMDYNMDFAMQCKPGFDVGVKNIVRTSGQFFPANYATIKVGAGDMANFYGLNCANGISGTVIININGPVTFISEAPGALVPTVLGNTVLTYNISDFGTVNFNSDFRFIIQTDTLAQAGSIICISVNVTPITGDNDTANNTLQHCFTVVNSFDPNDKQVFPSGVVLPYHEWLTYTIRFQNTGTAPAQHIYILDTLDVNLDVSTFTLLSYSHDNLTQVIGNVVKFNFPNINLPDSTNDEPNSHGYVQYKIKLNPGLPIGTTISNTAYNFFDFNPPVATNTVVNQIYFLNPTITPNNLILCPNESDTLWTQVYDSYQWFKDGSLIPGATQQFLVVDYFNDAGSQFMVEVDSAGVIAQSAPVLVDGWAFLPPFVIQEGNFTIGPLGEMIICPGDTAYLILGLPYDTNIQWTNNGNVIPGANDDTLIVTQAGLYNVSGSPSQCPNYVQSLFDNVQVVIAPPLAPTITPNNLILCPNESDTLFTQVFGSYQWYKDGNLIPGATNQYLVVDAFNDAGSQFSVEVSQGNCTGTSSQVLVDGWAFLPPFVISEGNFTTGPNGEMLVCPGDTAYLILGLPYDTNIQWTNNGNVIPGANDDTLVVTQSGMYHVSGAPSICPNFVQNLGVTIEVIVQGPPTPVITFTGNTLQTQSGFNYQWFYNGNPVGTNSNSLPSQGAGTYTVTITDAQGCTAESLPFVITGIIENSVSGVVNVNYNSQTSTLQITRRNAATETEIFVSDVLGRVIADEKMSRGVSEAEIKLHQIKPGIYFVNLSEGGSVKFFVE